MPAAGGRIHRLLRAEYSELIVDEAVLVESPFAETTRDGRGLREVALGLTASKLIVAADRLDNATFCCAKSVDPSIESLQLRSVFPLECVRLSVHRRRKRKALEARLIDGRARYYELGGLGCRARSWNEWCMQVHRLLRDESEINTRRRSCDGWTKKHLYLGPEYEELFDEHYAPKPVLLATASVETVKNDLTSPRSSRRSERKLVRRRVSRFAEGVDERCQHALCISHAPSSRKKRIANPPRISPKSHLHRGLGPWTINPGDRVSLQSRLTQSLASVRLRETELRLPVSRRQLTRATTSLASLKLRASTKSALLFWTTDYWYRPRAAVEVYRDVRRLLDNRQRDYHRCGTTVQLRKLLKLRRRVTLCDISSTTLARQLTLVDRELFTSITVAELRTLARHRESRDAANLAAWVAFAHRATCLLQSEVLRIARVDDRARILIRLIRTAERCVDEGNFQSASSVVAALQSPAVYRLKATWAYLRSRHGTKYTATMAKLSKLFANTEATLYREAWMRVERGRGSSMPTIADVLARILGLRGTRDGCWRLDDAPASEIDRLAAWLESCQSRAINYNYPGESLAREFLLKARYREDRENFALSFRLEESK